MPRALGAQMVAQEGDQVVDEAPLKLVVGAGVAGLQGAPLADLHELGRDLLRIRQPTSVREELRHSCLGLLLRGGRGDLFALRSRSRGQQLERLLLGRPASHHRRGSLLRDLALRRLPRRSPSCVVAVHGRLGARRSGSCWRRTRGQISGWRGQRLLSLTEVLLECHQLSR